jgi:hypothetical protein
MSYATIHTYNIMGKADNITSCLEEFRLRPSDYFPCAADERDLNVRIEENEVDAFTEWCDVHSVTYKLV